MSIDGRQIRAARAILGLTQGQLASSTGVHRNTVVRAERKGPCPGFAAAIGTALEPLGVIFESTGAEAVVRFQLAGAS